MALQTNNLTITPLICSSEPFHTSYIGIKYLPKLGFGCMLQSKSPSICQHRVKQVFTSCKTLLFGLLEQSLQYIWFTNVPIERFSTITIYACPKPGPGFPMSYVVGFFFVHSVRVKMRADCLLYGFW